MHHILPDFIYLQYKVNIFAGISFLYISTEIEENTIILVINICTESQVFTKMLTMTKVNDVVVTFISVESY